MVLKLYHKVKIIIPWPDQGIFICQNGLIKVLTEIQLRTNGETSKRDLSQSELYFETQISPRKIGKNPNYNISHFTHIHIADYIFFYVFICAACVVLTHKTH